MSEIKECFRDKMFLNAIYFSSRYFYKVAIKWIEDPNEIFDITDKVFLSLYKYYIRICTRCTPYGIFAGFSEGDISQNNSKFQFAEEQYSPILRTDMRFVKMIKDNILSKDIKKNIIYYPNNTIYKIGKKVRFIEWDDKYNYKISEVPQTSILEKIIRFFKAGLTFAEISIIVQGEVTGANKNEIESYINSIIRNKILTDALPPFLTSLEDPICELENSLKKINVSVSHLQPINKCRESLQKEINVEQIESLCINYKNIISENTQPFQVDLELNFNTINLNKKIVDRIIKSALELSVIQNNEYPNGLMDFKNKFHQRFANQEVSLTHALDPQIGVGYDFQISGNIEETPLLNDIHFSFKDNNKNIRISPIISLIIEKYINYFDYNNQKILILEEEDLRKITVEKKQAPFNKDYFLFGDLLANSTMDLDNGNFKFLSKASLPSSNMSNLISRFSYHNESLRHKMKESLKSANEENYIYAEIIHDPSDRIGNILQRPNFYDFEIPYVTESLGDKKKIDINDIYVSIKQNKIVIRSKSLNKEILPRFSTAYNYGKSQLSVIKFLGDLQYYNVYRGFNWDWSILYDNVFLPRVEYKELILAEARWKLNKDKSINIEELQKTINEHKIPRYCKFKKNDNVLLFDTKNELCLHIICNELKKNTLYLYESFHHTSFLSNCSEKFAAEFIFPVIQKATLLPNSKLNLVDEQLIADLPSSVKRKFYPGDEWSYFKIYSSHILGDQLLTKVISPLLKKYRSETANNNFCWFFIRYQDPEPHIRFRVKQTHLDSFISQLKELLLPLIDEGYVFSLKMDTYDREIERYGSKNMILSETIFHYDSNAVIKFLKLIDDEDKENVRWKTAILSIDLLLDDFNVSLLDRVSLFQNLYENFLPEFVNVSNKSSKKIFKISIDKQLRSNKKILDRILRLKDYEGLEEYAEPFIERSLRIRDIALIIMKNTSSNSSYLKLLQDYIHMSLNRLFHSKVRMHELVIYYLMNQSYNSIYFRNEKN